MTGSLEKLETILVVDDTPIVLSVVVAILKTANYNVLQANSGHEALKVAANHPGHIDLLLSDIQMPLMSGPELGETLLQTRRDIRLIFMSAFAGGSQLVLNHGWAFIEKPFVTQKLLEMINSVLHSPNKSVPPPKVQLTFDGQRQASAAVIDGCDDVLSCTESKRAMADGFDLVVHSLNGAIGDALLGPR